jgi:aminopeptidase N
MTPRARTWILLLLAACWSLPRAAARLDPADPRLAGGARAQADGVPTTWLGLPPSPWDDADRKGRVASALGYESWAPDPTRDPDSSGYDARHVSLEVEPLFAIEGLAGRVTWWLTITDPAIASLDFDLTQPMNVTMALIEDEPAAFVHENDRLRLMLPYSMQAGQIVRAMVEYSGVPELGFLWGFDYREHDGVPIVFTNCEPIAARTWWPCKDRPDDKFTADLSFIVPDTMIATSNGLLVETRALPGNRSMYVWRETNPITTYLVSLTATNFTEFAGTYTSLDGTRRMPLTYYAYPEHLPEAMSRWAFTPEAIGCFAGLFGEYPFLNEKYGMVEYPWAGAMEHQTLTSMGDYFQVTPDPTDWVVVHELAHQWWGDLVTCGTWRDIWLNEGFATYCEALWAESRGGPDSLRAAMLAKYADHFPGACYDPTFLFNATVYRKGAWVLHMLRHVIGDEDFFAALRLYAQRFAYGNAVTEDLRAVFEEVSGQPLDWFFAEWVYGIGQPSYRVRWNPVGSTPGDSTFVLIEIGQSTTGPECFKMPLDAVFSLQGGSEFATVLLDSLAQQEFLVRVPGRPVDLAVDPGRWVLGKVLFVAGPMSVEDHPPAPRSGMRLGAARPNPTRGETWIPVELAGGGLGIATSPDLAPAVLITDATGRLIRRLAVRELAEGRGLAHWDGRGESGDPAPAGVYFARPAATALETPAESRVRILRIH